MLGWEDEEKRRARNRILFVIPFFVFPIVGLYAFYTPAVQGGVTMCQPITPIAPGAPSQTCQTTSPNPLVGYEIWTLVGFAYVTWAILFSLFWKRLDTTRITRTMKATQIFLEESRNGISLRSCWIGLSSTEPFRIVWFGIGFTLMGLVPTCGDPRRTRLRR